MISKGKSKKIKRKTSEGRENIPQFKVLEIILELISPIIKVLLGNWLEHQRLI